MTSYLDHAATTPLRPVAREAWLAASERVGNPSSLHAAGRAARAVVEDARERIAAALGAHPTEVIFTSGATEANNLAIKGGYWARAAADAGARGLVTTAVEHVAALEPARWLAARHGARLVEVGVDADAVVDVEAWAEAMREGDVALASVQWVNNEVGTVQPLAELVETATAVGVPVHCDAVQGIGHAPFSFVASGLATAAVSGHKVGGPVGVGVLLARRGAALVPLTHGGGQERRVRSGTLDAPGAAALAVALEEAVATVDAEAARLATLAARLGEAIIGAAPRAVVHGPAVGSHGGGERALSAHRSGDTPGAARRSAHTPQVVHAIVPGTRSEALLVALDAVGVHASPGSACTAGVIEPSHVVLAMGYAEAEANATVRFSLGWSTTQADVDAAIAALPGAIAAASYP